MDQRISQFYKNSNFDDKLVKLHLGCGSKYLHGWCNIDAYPGQATDTHRGEDVSADIWCDIKKLPTLDNTVDLIYTSHVIEHFYRHSAIELFHEFFRVLKPNGLVITEMPDLNRVLFLLRFLPWFPINRKSIKSRRHIVKSQLYGAAWEKNDDSYPYHKYVWERYEFCEMLDEIGFKVLLQTGATQTHVPFRDMAVVCHKPVDGHTAEESRIDHTEILASYGTRASRFKKQCRSIYNLTKIGFRAVE